jgi:thiamine biosynthesis lipoprotein
MTEHGAGTRRLSGADPLADHPRLRRVEQVMGTAISLDIAAFDDAAALADEVFTWLCEVDERFSTYRDDSEVSRLDRGELTTAAASVELRTVLAACAGLWRDTDGFFDAYATGRLDPSGYVKGWAVQVASDRMLAAGAANHCLNAGGDVRIRGNPRPGEPWRVGIRHPWDPMAVCFVVVGTDLAVATSGTYERGTHVVNPRNGRPATALRSVTVTGSDLGRADAYATAALAMGEPGIGWLATLTAQGYESAVVAEDGRWLTSDGFPQLTQVDIEETDRGGS